MNKILIILMLLGCNKVFLSEKNKEYEEVSLNIDELILSAIHDNDLPLLDYYLSNSDNINLSIGDRGTFLHVASEVSRLSVVKKLLELGADPLIKNGYGKYAYELTNNKDIINAIKDYVIRQEVLIAANNRENKIFKILLSKNKNALFLKVKNLSLLEELCNILTWKEDKEIFSLIIELLKDNFEKTIYVKKRIIEKGANEIETREELNEYINMLEELKTIDNSYYPSKNFINNYIKIALRKGYISEFNILVKLENKQNIAIALLDEFLENNSVFLENFSHNFNFINDIFKKLQLGDVIKHLDKKNNLKNKVWNFLAKNPSIDMNKISKFYNLFIKDMEFKFNKSVNSLYIKGEEKEIKLFLTYHLIDLILSPIDFGYLFLYCSYKNYEEIVEYLIHKELVIKDTRVLQNYIIEKNLIDKLIESNSKKAIKKLLEVVLEKVVKEELIVDYSFEKFNEELIYLLKKRGNNFNNGEYLKAAIEKENLDIVKLVLEDFENVDYINRENLLIKVCEKGNVKILNLLIHKGANINNKSESGWTPLMKASLYNYKKIVELLLEKGADIDNRCNFSSTALAVASFNGHKEIAKLLLEKGANINNKDSYGWTALMKASMEGYKEIVELLIERGANINEKDNDGDSALILACQDEHIELVKFLLEEGANIYDKNNNGWSPLMIVSKNGHVELVKLLLKKGANINDKNSWKSTALIEASGAGHKDIVNFLLDNGANISDAIENGWTALMVTAQNGHKEVVEILLKRGAEVNAKDHNNWTLLMTTSYHGHTDIVRILIEKGANINDKNNDGWSPLMVASENGNTDTVELLLQRGAGINDKNNYEWSSLMIASKNGHIGVVKLLLEEGADVNYTNNLWQTALTIAIEQGHKDIAALLKEKGASS